MAGLSEKDWIWFLAYNYASEGDYPKNGLGAAMAIYRGFKPWWLFAGLFGNSVGLDASNFSTQRQFIEPAMPQATFAYGPGSPAIGVAATYRASDYYVRFGLYGEPYKNASTDDEGMGFHGRAIWQPHRMCGVEAVEEGRFTIPTIARCNDELRFNYRCEPGGWIYVELLPFIPSMMHADVSPIAGFTFGSCDALVGDSLDKVVTWNGDGNISAIGEMVAIMVRMFRAKLFAYSV